MNEESAAGCTIPVFIVAFFATGGIVGRFIDPQDSLKPDQDLTAAMLLVNLVMAILVSYVFFRLVRKR